MKKRIVICMAALCVASCGGEGLTVKPSDTTASSVDDGISSSLASSEAISSASVVSPSSMVSQSSVALAASSVAVVTNSSSVIAVSSLPVSVSSEAVSSSSEAAPQTPRRILAETFDRAKDRDTQNIGGCGRNAKVDMEQINVAGDLATCFVANTHKGEWLEFDFEVVEADTFNFYLSLATLVSPTAKVELSVDGVDIGSAVSSRRGWEAFSDLKAGSHKLSKGLHTLRVSFTGSWINLHSIALIPTVEDRGPAIYQAQLINTQTNKAVTTVDLVDQGTMDINADDFGGNNLTLRVVTEGEVASVKFGLNDRASYIIDDSAPFAMSEVNFTTSKFDRWGVFPGEHALTITPYSASKAQGVPGIPFTATLRLLQSDLVVNDETMNIINTIGGANTTAQFTITNNGNGDGAYQLTESADWLTLSGTRGVIAPGASKTITLSAGDCTTVKTQYTALSFNDKTIDVHYACSAAQTRDLAIDRFYFNQAVPVMDSAAQNTLPVVKGRKGLARAFVTRADSAVGLPEVTLFYRKANGDKGQFELSGPNKVYKRADEGKLNRTFNADLPVSFFQPGTEFYVQVDPNNSIAEANEDNNRYPREGYQALDIYTAPNLDILFVPVVISTPGASGLRPQLPDSKIAELMVATQARYPLESFTHTVRKQPFSYAGRSWSQALTQLNALRGMNSGEQYYHGLLAEKIPNSGTAGIGFTPGKAALSLMYSNTVAHELGHNLSLKHIDCGAPRFDTAYPHPGAITGSWGYDMFEKVLMAPSHKDFMSYCGPVWISEYHYNKVMDYRAPKVNAQQKAQLASAVEPVFMVTGHITDSGTQQEAASATLIFPTNKKVPLVTSGQYRADVVDSQDQVLFSTTFNSQSLDHSEQKNFTFNVPRQVLANQLQTLRISHDDVLLLETSIGEGQTIGVQKASSPVQALRMGGGAVKVSWLVGEGEQLLIRDNVTQSVLALDDTGSITVYSDSDTLAVIRIQSSGQTAHSTITVSD